MAARRRARPGGPGLMAQAALLLCAASARSSPDAGERGAGAGDVFARQAYVTLVTTPAYVIGAQTLAKVGAVRVPCARVRLRRCCPPVVPGLSVTRARVRRLRVCGLTRLVEATLAVLTRIAGGQCLRHTGTRRPLVALVGNLVPDSLAFQLEDAGIQVARIPDVVRKRIHTRTARIPDVVERTHARRTCLPDSATEHAGAPR